MSVTAYKGPGTAANVDRDSKRPWYNLDNVKTDDSNPTYCQVDKGTYGDWLRATNFGFSSSDIPSGSTINGIEVSIYKIGPSSEAITDSAIYMRDSAGQVGDNQASATAWPSTKTEVVYGGSADMLGTSLDQADIVSSTFGIDVSANNSDSGNKTDSDVYFIRIRVYYTAVNIGTIGVTKLGNIAKVSGKAMTGIVSIGGVPNV